MNDFAYKNTAEACKLRNPIFHKMMKHILRYTKTEQPLNYAGITNDVTVSL